MSRSGRSKRRYMDKSWCRGCDTCMVNKHGYGRCPNCMQELKKYKLERTAPKIDRTQI